MFQHGDLVLRQKRLDRQGVVCRGVLPHFRSSSHPFTKVCQNLIVVDLFNGLTFRHPIHVNNPSDVEKKISSLLYIWICSAALSFALVNWGSSSAWIGAYFLGRIEKT